MTDIDCDVSVEGSKTKQHSPIVKFNFRKGLKVDQVGFERYTKKS